MNKTLLYAVLLMLVAIAIVCHGAQPPLDLRLRYGKKRSFQVDFPSVTGKR